MSSRLRTARETLFEALAPVMPGRVDAYPPAPSRAVAPKVWIGVEAFDPATIGTGTRVTLVRFPVVVVYDGAVHAQVAGLDDLLSAVVDRINATPGFEFDGSRPEFVAELAQDTTIRAHVVTATATITARTFCPPVPVTADVIEGPADVVFTPFDPEATAMPPTPLEPVTAPGDAGSITNPPDPIRE